MFWSYQKKNAHHRSDEYELYDHIFAMFPSWCFIMAGNFTTLLPFTVRVFIGVFPVSPVPPVSGDPSALGGTSTLRGPIDPRFVRGETKAFERRGGTVSM